MRTRLQGGRDAVRAFLGHCRVGTAQGKQGILFLLFPDRQNTEIFLVRQGNLSRVPTGTGNPGKPGKMRQLFPVREKSGNFK